MKKILLLNGAPRCGKDTMAAWFEEQGWFHGKFSKVLKERTHELYGLKNIPYDYYEGVKDLPHEDFFGISPRQAYINVSERLMKPVHGDDIWVRMFIRELESTAHDYVIVSDLGFQVEWETLIQHFGYDKISLGVIYRAGYDFSNDSRNYVAPRGPWKYIKPPGPEFGQYIMNNCWDISNGGTLDDLYKECAKIDAAIQNNEVKPVTGRGLPIGCTDNSRMTG